MAARGVDGIGVAAIAAGTVIAYAGIKGITVLSVVQSVVGGHNPANADAVNAVGAQAEEAARRVAEAYRADAQERAAAGAGGTPDPSTGGSTGDASGLAAQLVTQATSYVGEGYQWAGVPSKGPGHWDCSSFVNWCVGRELSLPIPGYASGTYHGQSHGPVALAWLAWTGATTISKEPSAARPGDLCCWATHIGIAIGGGKMVSARKASAHPPTGIDTIGKNNIPGETLYIRRMKALGG